jgi:S1-C subfamily serine protease
VGINTAIIAFAQGLGFAIPANTAKWVVGEVLSHGQVRRRQLGITATVTALPRPLVRELDLLTDHAVEVVEVVPRSPADSAGVRRGDLIVAVNDRIVATVDDLHRLLTAVPVAAALELTLVREERRVTAVIESGPPG